jgi:hypothetical protein
LALESCQTTPKGLATPKAGLEPPLNFFIFFLK